MNNLFFKAWVKKEQRMVNPVGVNPFYIDDLDRTHWNYDEVELLRHTGVLDKNDNEIYEKDIVIAANGVKGVVMYGEWEYEFGQEHSNIWSGVGFYWKFINEPFGKPFKGGYEIVGNIYQTPELV